LVALLVHLSDFRLRGIKQQRELLSEPTAPANQLARIHK
jgi:hypothetical protein